MPLIKFIFRTILLGIAIMFMAGIAEAYPLPLFQQAGQDTVETDSSNTRPDTLKSTPDTLQITTDTLEGENAERMQTDSLKEQRSVPKIQPWQFETITGLEHEASDSTLRWQMWSDWLGRTNRMSGAVTYRRGRMGYNETMLYHAHESRHQELAWEGHALNDPVTGMVRWAELPHHKINNYYHDREGGIYQANFNLNQYYVNQPESRFLYDEGRFNYRNLEFMVTRNFSRKTNAEISYWLRRDGGGYSRDNSSGNQIYGRVYHHLDNDRFLKAAFLHNGFDLNQSFGYRIPDMSRFNFDRFTTPAREREASSSWSSNYLNIGYYRRNAPLQIDRYRVKLFMRNIKRRVLFSRDTSRYNVHAASAKFQAWKETKTADFYGEMEVARNRESADQSPAITRSGWSQLTTRGAVELDPGSNLNFSIEPMFSWRSDNYMEWEIGAEAGWDIQDLLHLKIDGAQGQYMPTPQQLYWDSESYAGNNSLASEQISTVGSEIKLHPSYYYVGVRGRIKDINNGIFMDLTEDSAFTNAPGYQSTMAETFIGIDHPHFEWEATAAWHRYGSERSTALLNDLTAGPARFWLKSSAYVKGYVFDRAAYVKAGLFGMYSPNYYRSSQYIAPLGTWQSANDTELIPPFYRVDLDISARVRKIMVHLRWENVTNRLGQLGYFETANYPMPGRRFMFGIRVIFTN